MSEQSCPNCGAPKRGAVCEYCGTHFGRYQGQATVEVDSDYVDIFDWSGKLVSRIFNDPNVRVEVMRDE